MLLFHLHPIEVPKFLVQAGDSASQEVFTLASQLQFQDKEEG